MVVGAALVLGAITFLLLLVGRARIVDLLKAQHGSHQSGDLLDDLGQLNGLDASGCFAVPFIAAASARLASD